MRCIRRAKIFSFILKHLGKRAPSTYEPPNLAWRARLRLYS